jgi:hypothetical protein
MAVIESFTVAGFPELFKAMDELKEEIGKGKTDRIWRDTLKAAMQPVLNSAKAAAPKDSGQLADNIYLSVHRPKQRDKAGKYFDGEMYMARVSVSAIRKDTGTAFVVNKRGKLQTVRTNKKPVAVSQEFGNARVPGNPFLRVSLERNARTVAQILEDLLKLKINEIARKVAREGKV